MRAVNGAQVALEHPFLKKGAGYCTVKVAWADRARVGEKPGRKRGTFPEDQL